MEIDRMAMLLTDSVNLEVHEDFSLNLICIYLDYSIYYNMHVGGYNLSTIQARRENTTQEYNDTQENNCYTTILKTKQFLMTMYNHYYYNTIYSSRGH